MNWGVEGNELSFPLGGERAETRDCEVRVDRHAPTDRQIVRYMSLLILQFISASPSQGVSLI